MVTTLILLVILILVPLLSSSFVRTSFAFQSGEDASVVLGQFNFTATLAGGNGTGLFGPEGITVDSKGNVWVSDSENNRVLEFTKPFSTGEGASVVLGQENFSSYLCGAATLANLCDPQGIAFDSSGNLYVADNSNNRVLEFKPPFSDGESASLSIGVTSNNTTQSSLDSPIGVALDSSNNLWVVDSTDQRVLKFSAPLSNNESASLVIGQTNYVSNSSGANQSGFNAPTTIAFDHSGDLWVTDSSNHRVMEFPSPLSTGENATVEIGQANFSSSNTTGSQSVLPSPYGIAFDSTGNLWVSDTYDGRVLEFSPPFSNGENASLVIGQATFNASVTSASQSLLSGPEALAFDPSGNLWVLDSSNNRALEFTPSGVVATQSSSSTTSSSSSSTSSSSSAIISTSVSTSSRSSSVVSTTSTVVSTTSASTTTTSTSTSSHSASSLSASYLYVIAVVLFISALLSVPVARKRKLA